MRKSFFYWSFVFYCIAWFPGFQVTLGDDQLKSRVTTAGNKTESVEIRDFEVRVDNKPAGTHRLTIKCEGDTNEVAFQTDVKFDFIVYAYVFKFRGKEIWRDGRLEQSEIRCEDGGKKRMMALKTDGAVQQISFNGKSVPANSQCVMSTAYWCLPSEELRGKPIAIVDVDSGNTRSASLNLVGPTTITTSGRSLTCHHFKIDGPSPAELWFDDRHRLVRQKSVEQGHLMELRLKDIRISNEDK